MIMDPRIEAALVEFARTRLPPPGYVLRDCRDASCDVYIFGPWSVTNGDWLHSDATEAGAIAAAWVHSDRHEAGAP